MKEPDLVIPKADDKLGTHLNLLSYPHSSIIHRLALPSLYMGGIPIGLCGQGVTPHPHRLKSLSYVTVLRNRPTATLPV